MAGNSTDPLYDDQDYMIGPVSEIRIKSQTGLLSLLLIFSIINNGVMLILFARFKSLRRVTNYLLIDLTIVEFFDTAVNIPIFMKFFLMTKKKNLERQTRWYAMLFHRYFLLNDLFTQISQTIDCFLAIKYGKHFTSKKTSKNIKALIAFKWVAILAMLIAFMAPTYTYEEEYVSDEAYQRLLFGPNQVIWKIVIPSCQLFAVVAILMTNRLIKNSRNLVSKRYGMRTFGRGSKNSSKAVNTLTLIMVIQTLCKVPAAVYSYVAVDDRVEGNRWFAFFSYFFLFTSSSVMPLVYFWRTVAFRRALQQIRKHPFAASAYLDYAAQHGLRSHRNGRLHLDPKIMKRKERVSPKLKEILFTEAENTRETDLSSRTATFNSSRPLSLATEASLLEIPMSFLPQAQLEVASCKDDKPRPEGCRTKSIHKSEESQGSKEDETAESSSQEDLKRKTEKLPLQSSSSGASGPSDVQDIPDDSKLGNSREEETLQEQVDDILKNTGDATPIKKGNMEAVVSCKSLEEQEPIAEAEQETGLCTAQKVVQERNEEGKVHEEGSKVLDGATQVPSIKDDMDDAPSHASSKDAGKVDSHDSEEGDAVTMEDQKPLQESKESKEKEKEEGAVGEKTCLGDSSKVKEKDVANNVKKDEEAAENSSLVVQAMIHRELASVEDDLQQKTSLDDSKQDFVGYQDVSSKGLGEKGKEASLRKNSLMRSQETAGASDQAELELGYDNLGFDTKL